MSKLHENSDIQPPLFGASSDFPGALDNDALVRSVLTDTIKQSAKSRDQICEEMSRLIGREITVPMVDAFTADSKRNHRFPAAWLHAFCVVTGDWRLLQCLVERAGFRMVDSAGAKLLELGRRVVEQEIQQRKTTALLDQVVTERQSL
ncbi:MAG TPA: hypothetical protein VN622_09040 [Clostridia bacterium]|nr:hypothetical protein [Clostridia bacterium]